MMRYLVFGRHTGQGQELVSNVDGRVVLMLMHSVLAPLLQQLLHILARRLTLSRPSRGSETLIRV